MAIRERTVQVEITYSVPLQNHAVAMWIATEFFRAFGKEVAITISPRYLTEMEVFVDGQKIFDRHAEGAAYPDFERVRKMSHLIANAVRLMAVDMVT
jgi:predicted Rdx family selenoprotein